MSLFKRHPKAAAILFSLLVPGATYLGLALFFGGAAPWLAVAIVPLLGFALGRLVSDPSGPVTAGRITAAALFGLSTAWLLLVVVTLGFALLGAPLLPAYALAVHWGQRAAAQAGADHGHRIAPPP